MVGQTGYPGGKEQGTEAAGHPVLPLIVQSATHTTELHGELQALNGLRHMTSGSGHHAQPSRGIRTQGLEGLLLL